MLTCERLFFLSCCEFWGVPQRKDFVFVWVPFRCFLSCNFRTVSFYLHPSFLVVACGEGGYASVAEESVGGGNLTARLVALSSSMLEEERIVVQPREKVVEDVEERTVVFRCRNVETGWIEGPPLKELLPPFVKWLEGTTSCSRGLKFGTLKFGFSDGDGIGELDVFFQYIGKEDWCMWELAAFLRKSGRSGYWKPLWLVQVTRVVLWPWVGPRPCICGVSTWASVYKCWRYTG